MRKIGAQKYSIIALGVYTIKIQEHIFGHLGSREDLVNWGGHYKKSNLNQQTSNFKKPSSKEHSIP